MGDPKVHPWVGIKDRHLVQALPTGAGLAIEIGGGDGRLKVPIARAGYDYVNVDLAPGQRILGVAGLAENLPLKEGIASLIVSQDALHHFIDPARALKEMARVSRTNATLILWVPFMYPSHGGDRFRFSPTGLRQLLTSAGYMDIRIEAPLWIWTVLAVTISELFIRLRLGVVARFLIRAAARLDVATRSLQGSDMSFAAAYLVTARMPGEPAS